ncbi:PD40 domain-containing protein [Brachyspira hyodysenteriae]|uniref:PD40 domain-containing protein n=1 Tax=Brachyspira hyodysenteriae TaxID=159 RepID=UPI000A159D51|nr:PD40 domain-containing protein [Brachyspira hyodysenteriae]WPC38387.1 PD40 domain-containing protein [Brachyspira hyodysenteriae]
MKKLYIISIVFLLLCARGFTQVYTFQIGEKLNNSYILSETNYAIIIEKNSANSGKTFDIIYKNTRLTGYKDAGNIKILPNGTLIATMLKTSLGKDMWVVIYGNIEQEFDSIEREIYSGNNSIIFTRLMDYGVAVINGEAKVQYSELYDSVINDNSYAFSYSRDGQYFVNINGEEKQVSAKADRLKFSNDGNNIVYVIENEGNAVIFTGSTDSENFVLVDDLASFNNNSIAYAVKMLPQTMTNDTNAMMTNGTNMMMNDTNSMMTNDIITNTTTVTNYNLSNVSVYTNEEGVTVKGQSNTIALMVVTNVITNIRYNELPDLPAAADSTNSIITNEFIMTSVVANGRNYGEFNSVTNMSFSPDGKTLVFVNINSNNTMQLYVGGNMTTNYDMIHNYKYSDDSKILAYSAQTNNVSFLIVNGKRLPRNFDKINDIYFSTNNSLVYNASINGREYIIANDFESPSYNRITSFKFLGDSFAFTAERLGKYYYFILNKNNSLRREFGGYDYVSAMDNNQTDALSIVSDGKNIFIIKNGMIVNNQQ